MKYLGYLKKLPWESDALFKVRCVQKIQELKELMDGNFKVRIKQGKAHFYLKEKT